MARDGAACAETVLTRKSAGSNSILGMHSGDYESPGMEVEMATYYTIDPARFNNGQWEELTACTHLIPATYESRRSAKPFRRQRFQIMLAIQVLSNKIFSVLEGQEDFAGQNASWAYDLSGAILQLSIATGDIIVCRKCGGTQAYALAKFDEGDGPKAGKTFGYCCEYCKETH